MKNMDNSDNFKQFYTNALAYRRNAQTLTDLCRCQRVHLTQRRRCGAVMSCDGRHVFLLLHNMPAAVGLVHLGSLREAHDGSRQNAFHQMRIQRGEHVLGHVPCRRKTCQRCFRAYLPVLHFRIGDGRWRRGRRWCGAEVDLLREPIQINASGDANYMTSMLHKFNQNILLWGNSGRDVVGGLPEFNQDYIFSYILNSYGLLAGIFVAAILAVLVLFMFGAAARQKNELGMVMGFGCGMIILLNISLNFAGMLGWIPLTSTFLPFLSVGRNNILLCYALVEIILSIYRYKDVYPKKFKASQVSLQKTITLNLNM